MRRTEIGWSVRFWFSPSSCHYELIDGNEARARQRFDELSSTYRRVELLKLNIEVVEKSDK